MSTIIDFWFTTVFWMGVCVWVMAVTAIGLLVAWLALAGLIVVTCYVRKLWTGTSKKLSLPT